MVPVCLKPGCSAPDPPSSGRIILQAEYNDTLAVVECSPGHAPSAPGPLACLDGKHWNSTVPQCHLVSRVYVHTTVQLGKGGFTV